MSVGEESLGEQDFHIDKDICHDDDGQVEIFSEYETEKSVWAEMIRCKGHG